MQANNANMLHSICNLLMPKATDMKGKPMTAQIIAMINITDAESLAQYREKAGDALSKHGGKVIAGGPKPESLEAAHSVPDILVIIEFPSADHARAWRNDPELTDIHALRNKGGQSSLFILPQG